MFTDEHIADLVRSGYFRVEADGSVWRLNVGTRTGGRRAITPTRADYVARKFGVTPTLIRKIVSGTAWKHVSFPEAP
jgi:hypothetical protein